MDTEKQAGKSSLLRGYIKIARPDHWIKNLFIVPGFFVAWILVPEKSAMSSYLLPLLLAFIATSLVASANYVINEWLDAEFDKFHPVKKYRPVVVSNLKFSVVMAEYVVLTAAGLALAWKVNAMFFWMALWLWVMGVLYNVEPIRTKDLPFIDVLSESVNNMIRLLMGWFVVAYQFIPPCSIILGYWMAGAFLMGMKRFAEYRMIDNPETAGLYRKSFKHYSVLSLLVSSLCYGMLSTFFIGIFLVQHRPEFLICIPFLIMLFGKYVAISFRADSAAQKPEKLYREKGLMILVAVFTISVIVAFCVDMPWLRIFTVERLVPVHGFMPYFTSCVAPAP